MDAPSLSPERSKELADLRRRAYGPEADIQRDPAAQRRLDELEALARASPTGDVPSTAPAHSEADDGRELTDPGDEASALLVGRPENTAEPAPVSAQTEAPRQPPARSRVWWKRIPLWSVTTLVGVAAGVAIGLAWPSIGSESPPDLTLGIDPDGGERAAGFNDAMDYWGVDPGTVVPHEAFDVIRVWTARGADDSSCVLLSHDGQLLTATCAGAGLEPVLDFTVFDGMALELDAPLPVGTVIRFSGGEGAVDVWVRPPGGQREEPEAMTSASDSLPSAA